MVCYVQIQHPHLRGRYDHSATAISLTGGLTEVTFFGGKNENAYKVSRADATSVLRFGECHFVCVLVTLALYWQVT